MIKKLLSKEISKVEAIELKLLAPSRWYNSNMRAFKLETTYKTPPVLAGNVEKYYKSFYAQTIAANSSNQNFGKD